MHPAPSPDPYRPRLPTTALRLEGGDALALLHAIGTQALADLAPGSARATLFCDFRGRLLYRAHVARASDDAVWLLRDDGAGDDLAAFIERHVFREDVRVIDRSRALRVRLVRDTASEPHRVSERDGRPERVGLEAGWALAIGDDAAPTSDAEIERARVRAGLPVHGHEIRDEFFPHEVGLAHDVHLDKGCFTGQEILLRLLTRGAMRRRLALVRGDGAMPLTPCDLLAGERGVGRLTRAVREIDDAWIALAVLDVEHASAASELRTADGARVLLESFFPESVPLGRP